MAEGNAEYISKENFKAEVRRSIAADWWSVIEHSDDLRSKLDNILSRLYDEYEPRRDGNWSANPKWTEMFQWTTCPFHDIRGIIVLMEPVKPASNNQYRSTGYAFGVERIYSSHQMANIKIVSTVWNFLYLLHEMQSCWTPYVRKALAERYQNGFSPEHLSKELGLLFLNLAFTRGIKSDRYDLNMWEPFVHLLLNTIAIQSNATGSIPVIQLYNTDWLETYFTEGQGQSYHVLRPRFMDVNACDKIMHLCYFMQECPRINRIPDYIDHVRKPEFKWHQSMLTSIFNSLFSSM